MPSKEEYLELIQKNIADNTVFVFMKGEKGAPMCGFSGAVCDVFNQLGVPYEAYNVLPDPQFRYVLQEFSGWPTIPQVFVGGKLVGGCDITIEMAQKGELQKVVEDALSAKKAG